MLPIPGWITMKVAHFSLNLFVEARAIRHSTLCAITLFINPNTEFPDSVSAMVDLPEQVIQTSRSLQPVLPVSFRLHEFFALYY